MGFYQLYRTQKILASIDEVWDFISSPGNLKRITPDYMGFEITSRDLPAKMHPGMIVCYKVSPFMGFKMTWISEITHVEEKSFFVDEQKVGPYRMWHHQHRIEALDKGVLMSDLVTYQPPLGVLGSLGNLLFIQRKLAEIFEYRKKSLIQIFGEFKLD